MITLASKDKALYDSHVAYLIEKQIPFEMDQSEYGDWILRIPSLSQEDVDSFQKQFENFA